MKKITTLLTALLLVAASVSFAADTKPVPKRVAAALTADFENASNVAWKTVDAYYKATFTIEDETYGAFYNVFGELVATSRKRSVKDLPMNLQNDLKEIAPVYNQEELFELLTENGTEYFVKFNDGKESKSYQSGGDGWSRI